MVFSSTVFLFIFLPILLAAYYFPKKSNRTYKNVLLFIASILFYAYGEPLFVFVLLVSILITWILGIQIEKSEKKKTWMIIGVFFHVGLLFIFKYLSFLSGEVYRQFKVGGIVKLGLPIGISFFTFQLLSYLFDVYYGKTRVQRNLVKLGLYVSLFPQLVAGPIVRYSQIENEIDHRVESLDLLVEGAERFICGLGKKVLLADYLGILVDRIFAGEFGESVLILWIGAISYTLQIYFDFSGYSDMAIGLGRMFGFHFEENFNYPYMAKNVTDFWRRWHISLSQWFRDYVYIPLGGNRCSKAKWIRNLAIVWVLTGVWHGANWTFLVWGMGYFVVLLFEKLTGIDKRENIFTRIGALVVVTLLWVIFRADSIGVGVAYIKKMFGYGASGFTDLRVGALLSSGGMVLAMAIVLSTPIVAVVKKRINSKIADIFGTVMYILIFVLSICTILGSTYSPFIYFNF